MLRFLIVMGIFFSTNLAAFADDHDFELTSISVELDTPKGDNKDDDTAVEIEVFGKKGNNNILVGRREKFDGNVEYKDPSKKTVDIPVVEKITLNQLNLLSTSIKIYPNGNDRWIFNNQFTLTFKDSKTKATKKITQVGTGIILDQNNPKRENATWVRFPESALKHKLTKATIAFVTPAKNDNKDGDTSIDVKIDYPLNEKRSIRAVEKLNFAGDTEFPDDGTSHEFILELKSPMTLQQFDSSTIRVEIHPKGNDRWIFEAHLTLVFEGEGDKLEIPVDRSAILDQDNRVLSIDP